jgi:hypothetical protein
VNLDDIRGFLAWLQDPESDPALVFAIEEQYGVVMA